MTKKRRRMFFTLVAKMKKEDSNIWDMIAATDLFAQLRVRHMWRILDVVDATLADNVRSNVK